MKTATLSLLYVFVKTFKNMEIRETRKVVQNASRNWNIAQHTYEFCNVDLREVNLPENPDCILVIFSSNPISFSSSIQIGTHHWLLFKKKKEMSETFEYKKGRKPVLGLKEYIKIPII